MTNNQVAALVERIESMEAERAAYLESIKEIYTEAKSLGIDTKALRAVVARRRKDSDKTRELEERMQEYMSALGDFAFTPLGEAMKKHVSVAPSDGMDIPTALDRRPKTSPAPFND